MKRFWEIDALRGLAIIKMIISNFIFDLVLFTDYDFSSKGFLLDFSRTPIAAITFMFLLGVSLAISYSRIKNKSRKQIYRKYVSRGVKILSLGILITLVTWVLFDRKAIFFGVLHFVGAAIILSMPLLRFRKLNMVLGAAFVLIGVYLSSLTFDFPWLLWLGFVPWNLYTLDYFPIFPWFGIALIGIFVGHSLYPNGKRSFYFPDLSKQFSPLSWLGRRSLMVYLIHQPAFVAALMLLGIV